MSFTPSLHNLFSTLKGSFSIFKLLKNFQFLSLNFKMIFFTLKLLKEVPFLSIFLSINYWKNHFTKFRDEKKKIKFRDENKLFVKFKKKNILPINKSRFEIQCSLSSIILSQNSIFESLSQIGYHPLWFVFWWVPSWPWARLYNLLRE